jgi:hypothetical protein
MCSVKPWGSTSESKLGFANNTISIKLYIFRSMKASGAYRLEVFPVIVYIYNVAPHTIIHFDQVYESMPL